LVRGRARNGWKVVQTWEQHNWCAGSWVHRLGHTVARRPRARDNSVVLSLGQPGVATDQHTLHAVPLLFIQRSGQVQRDQRHQDRDRYLFGHMHRCGWRQALGRWWARAGLSIRGWRQHFLSRRALEHRRRRFHSDCRLLWPRRWYRWRTCARGQSIRSAVPLVAQANNVWILESVTEPSGRRRGEMLAPRTREKGPTNAGPLPHWVPIRGCSSESCTSRRSGGNCFMNDSVVSVATASIAVCRFTCDVSRSLADDGVRQ
jgi:hypothetical protein